MKRILILCLCLIVMVAACERRSRDYAGVSRAPTDTPAYTANPQVSSVSGESVMKDAFPKGEGSGPDGKALFAQHCSACHQLTGQGVPGAFPPLDGSPYVLSDKTDRMASIMLYGLVGPIKVKGTQFASAMAPLGGAMSDEELAAVASYVRSAWSNKAAKFEASVFAEMRKKWGTRGPFAITELGEEPS